MKIVDIKDQRFGRLVVCFLLKERRGGKAVWLCECDCGNVVEVIGKNLRNGNTQSCGCLQRERTSKANLKHGGVAKYMKTYLARQEMIQRCCNPNDKQYPDYGGRGIKVCDKWLDSFESFFRDMGECPGKGYSLDRIDNNGDYEPKNCRWATNKEQARNKRNNRMIEYKNQVKCVAEWAEELGRNYKTLWFKLKECDWQLDKLLSEEKNV